MALITGIDGLELLTTPANANQEITSLSSSNENVVRVIETTSNGITTYELRPMSEGTAIITATLDTDGIETTATTTVNVVAQSSSGSGSGSDSGSDDSNEDENGGGTGESSTDTGSATSIVNITSIHFHASNNPDQSMEYMILNKNPEQAIPMSSYVTILPSGTTARNWSLTSSNSSVVRAEGTNLYAIEESSSPVTITAKVIDIDDRVYTDNINVTVQKAAIEDISFIPGNISIPVGERRNINTYFSFTPAAARYSDYSFAVAEGNSVVHLDNNEIVADASGQAIIRVSYVAANSQSMTKDLIITVPEESSDSTNTENPITSFEVSCDESRVYGNDEFIVRIENINPINHDEGDFTIQCTNSRGSSSSAVTFLENDGLVYRFKASAVSSDELVYISAIWRSHVSNTSTTSTNRLGIVISKPGSQQEGEEGTGPESVSLQDWVYPEGAAYAKVGDTIQAVAICVPTGYVRTYTRWESGNTFVASINENGVITCLRQGTTAITVSIDGKTATKSLRVVDPTIGNDDSDWQEFKDLLGTRVASCIVPFTSFDEYPTHYAKYGKGGYRSVSSIEEMEAIPNNRREEGMLVWVISESSLYQYYNSRFIPISFSGSSSTVTPGGDIIIPGGTDHEDVDLSDILRRLDLLESLMGELGQSNAEKKLDSSRYTLSISGFTPSISETIVGTNISPVSFNWTLSPPSDLGDYEGFVPGQTIEIIEVKVNGQSISGSWSGNSFTGNFRDSSSPITLNSSGTKTWTLSVKYKDHRWESLGKTARTYSPSSSKSITFGYNIYYGDTSLEPSSMTWEILSQGSYGKKFATSLPTQSNPLRFRSNTEPLGRAWVAWPAAWGRNNIDIIGPMGESYAVNDFEYKSGNIQINGVEYNLFYLKIASAVSSFEYRFYKY